jgi:hypothetical protein
VQTYTVYEPRVPPEEVEERAAALVFVKEGFSFWTLIFPALWLLFHGLWRGLLAYLVLAGGLMAGLTQLGASEQVIAWGGFALNLIFAFEARDIKRASLERRGYVLKSVVSGRNLQECERRYLMEWLPQARRDRERAALTAATAATPAGTDGGGARPVPIIGMFPSHGG